MYIVTKIGYFTPFAIIGNALGAIGFGLFTTLDVGSSIGLAAGFQIIAGAARGMIQQQSITAAQAVLPKSQAAVGNSFIMFTQILGGAFYLCFAQTLFSNELKSALKTYAPEIDAELVFSIGAAAFRDVVPESSVDGVVQAYNRALAKIFVSLFIFPSLKGYVTDGYSSWVWEGVAWPSLQAGVWVGRM